MKCEEMCEKVCEKIGEKIGEKTGEKIGKKWVKIRGNRLFIEYITLVKTQRTA